MNDTTKMTAACLNCRVAQRIKYRPKYSSAYGIDKCQHCGEGLTILERSENIPKKKDKKAWHALVEKYKP